MGPKSVGDRTKTSTELMATWAEGSQPQPASNGGGKGSAAATESAEPVWDEDDVMLFFWSNSKAARERRAKVEQGRTDYIDEWKAGTSAN